MPVKTCPDCGAPVQENMLPTVQHGCWIWGQIAEARRREGVPEDEIARRMHTGADAPCEGNHYDHEQEQMGRERNGVAITTGVMLLIVFVVVAIVWWNA